MRNERKNQNFDSCFHLLRAISGTVRAYVEAGGVGNSNTLPGFQYRCFGSAIIERNPSFSTLNSDDINYFKGILGEKNVIQDEDRLSIANVDWMNKYKGSSKLLLQPRTTEEVEFFRSFRSLTCLRVLSVNCYCDILLCYVFSLQVSRILKYCNSRCLAVVPQGGNTGLVGGSVPVFDEVF